MPKVSFIVPCYNLAHLLPECITSILEQSYNDFEILIMDDCSPDNTTEKASRFHDDRIVYIRNKTNLGHLRNYNKGIKLSRGKYIWLISADDRLRRPYVLEKYVNFMEEHPEVGYVFCPGIKLEDNKETALFERFYHGPIDTIFDGKYFLSEKLMKSNCVMAPSGMARKQLYDTHGLFRLDLPYAGDWYLWCLFAIHSDVGYFAEPMVNYRIHNLNITNTFTENRARLCIQDDITTRWHIKHAIEAKGDHWLCQKCNDLIITEYGWHLACKKSQIPNLSIADFEESLSKFSCNPEEAKKIRARSYFVGGKRAFALGNLKQAFALHIMALKNSPIWPRQLAGNTTLTLANLIDNILKLFTKHPSS